MLLKHVFPTVGLDLDSELQAWQRVAGSESHLMGSALGCSLPSSQWQGFGPRVQNHPGAPVPPSGSHMGQWHSPEQGPITGTWSEMHIARPHPHRTPLGVSRVVPKEATGHLDTLVGLRTTQWGKKGIGQRSQKK